MKSMYVERKSIWSTVSIVLLSAILALCLAVSVTGRAADADNGILYFVDCGTSSADTSTPNGRPVGSLNNGKYDQAYTEGGWGYMSTGNTATTNVSNESGSVYNSVRANDDKNNKSHGAEYRFTIPTAGTYRYTVVFTDPWNNGSRSVNLKVGNNAAQNVAAAGNGIQVATGTVTTSTTNEVVSVLMKYGEGNTNQSPWVAAIVIADQATAIPLYASCETNIDNKMKSENKGTITVGDAVDSVVAEMTNASATVYFSDGQSKVYRVGDAGVGTAIHTSSVSTGQAVRGVMTFDRYLDFEAYPFFYTWAQEAGDSELYYNIDCGFTTTEKNPPDDATELGSKQSTTRDQAFGDDPDTTQTTSWGYVGTAGSQNWKDDDSNEWSIRGDAGTLTYKMTGFDANELLTIETGGHANGGWGARSYNVVCNGTVIGSIALPDSDARVYDTFVGQANAAGEVTLEFPKTSGGDAHVGYIKVRPATKESDITTTTTDTQDCGGSIELGNLNTNARVYVTDQNNALLGSFVPTAATATVQVSEYLANGTTQLNFVQASAACTASDAVTVNVTSHVYDLDAIEWTWNDTTATATVKCAHDHVLTKTAFVEQSGTVAPTCEQAGSTTYTASVLIDGTEKTDVQSGAVIPALGHNYDWDNATWTWSDDHTSATVTLTCKHDNEHTENHNATVTTSTAAATCEEGGRTTYTATVTEGVRTATDTYTEPTEPTGHDYDYAHMTWVWNEDKSEAVATVVCQNGDHPLQLSASVTAEVTKQPSVEAAGVRTHVATVVIGGTSYTDTQTTEIAKLTAPAEVEDPGDGPVNDTNVDDPADKPENDPDKIPQPQPPAQNSGCGSVAGGGAATFGLITLLAAAVVAAVRKRKVV